MAKEAENIVKALIERAVELGIDWEPELNALGPGPYTARQVVNAIGAAATRQGIGNNLVRNDGTTPPGT
jgi:hypothetical protein